MFSRGNYSGRNHSVLICSKPYAVHVMQARAHWKGAGFSDTMWTPYPLTIQARIIPGPCRANSPSFVAINALHYKMHADTSLINALVFN